MSGADGGGRGGEGGFDLAADLAALARIDKDIAAALERHGVPERRRREPGFAALLQIVVSQQVSLAAAGAIWGRLAAHGPPAPAGVLALGPEGLRAAGFSRPKIRYALALAERAAAGAFRPEDLAGMDDAGAAAALTALPGFGRWSADIYLLFCLGRRDAWPAGDVALREAMRALKGLDRRPDIDAMDALAEPWRPYRGAAAHLLWRHYRDIARPGAGRSQEAGGIG